MTDVEANGIRLHCRFDGNPAAPVMVLCNSIAMDLQMWEPQIPPFSARFRVLRYDARGHGRSEVPRGAYTLEQLGTDVIALLDALGIDRAYLCGLSLGGLTSLWIAARHPDRVERAAFASTGARIGTRELWEARAEMVRTGGLASLRDLQVSRFFTASFQRRHPDAVRRAMRAFRSMSEEGYIGACLALRDADLRAMVPEIRVPSLVVVGREDVATPPSDARWLHEHLPGSELVVLDGASHLCNIERPSQFAEAVLAFFGA